MRLTASALVTGQGPSFFIREGMHEMEKPRDDERVIDQVEEEYAALVTYEMAAKKWDELEAAEFGGRLLFPDVLHRRLANGKFEAERVSFRVPRQKELRAARSEARSIAAADGIDEEKDRGLFEDLGDTCILWHAIRNSTPPYEPLEIDPQALEARYDRDVLKLAWAKLEGYRRIIDPRPAAISREQVLAVVGSIAKRRDISPLHVFDGPAQSACIVFMASLLVKFMTPPSSPPSSESSTPEPSPSES